LRPTLQEKTSASDFETFQAQLNSEMDRTHSTAMTTALIDNHGVRNQSYGATDTECSPKLPFIHSSSGSGASSPSSPRRPPGFRDLLIPSIITLNINYALLCFCEQCVQVLIPLMYSTSIPLGGLGFSPYTIGLIMSIWGVCNGLIQILTFARLRKLLGHRNLYVLGISSYLCTLAAFPLMNILAKREGRVDAWVWGVLVFQLALCPLSYMSFGGVQICMFSRAIRLKTKCPGCMFIYFSRESPSPDALGSTNGLAQMTASTMRTLAPTVASSLFSMSLQWRLAGGTAVYWILYAFVLAGLYASKNLPDYSN
jgi:hypothetical protein